MKKQIIFIGITLFCYGNAFGAIISDSKSVNAATLYKNYMQNNIESWRCYKDKNLYLYFCNCSFNDADHDIFDAYKILPDCDPNATGDEYANGCKLPMSSSYIKASQTGYSDINMDGCTMSKDYKLYGACLPVKPQSSTVSMDVQNTACLNVCNCNTNQAPNNTACSAQHSGFMGAPSTWRFRPQQSTVCLMGGFKSFGGSKCDNGYYGVSKTGDFLTCQKCPDVTEFVKQYDNLPPTVYSAAVSTAGIIDCYVSTGKYKDSGGSFEIKSNCNYTK